MNDRLFGIFALALTGVFTAAVLAADPTPAELDRSMKKAGAGQQALQKAVAASSISDAKTQIAALRQAMNETQIFWTAMKKDDGVQMNKAVIAKLDALEKVMAAPAPDKSAAMAGVRDMTTACGSCHKVYRTTDEEGNFVYRDATGRASAAAK